VNALHYCVAKDQLLWLFLKNSWGHLELAGPPCMSCHGRIEKSFFGIVVGDDITIFLKIHLYNFFYQSCFFSLHLHGISIL
jgi:hypothetical protein